MVLRNRYTISIGNHMNLSAIWEIIAGKCISLLYDFVHKRLPDLLALRRGTCIV